MAEPIATWTDGDLVIQQMRSLAEQAHARVAGGELDATGTAEMREQAITLNKRLTQLESKFSAQLGEASRQTQRLLLVLNVALAALLALTGLLFVRRSARIQAATEDEVRHRQESLQRLLDSAAEGLFGVDTDGRCTFINRAALEMLGYEHESDLLGREIHELIQPAQAGAAHAASGDAARPSRAPGSARHRQRVLAPRRFVVSGRVLVASGRAGRPGARRGGDLLRHQRAPDHASRPAPGRAAHRQAGRCGHRRRHHHRRRRPHRPLQPRRRNAVRRQRRGSDRRTGRALHPVPSRSARQRRARALRRRRQASCRRAPGADRPARRRRGIPARGLALEAGHRARHPR